MSYLGKEYKFRFVVLSTEISRLGKEKIRGAQFVPIGMPTIC